MSHSLRLFVWWMLLAVGVGCFHAKAAVAESLHEALLADARDGVLDQFDLPSACLIACGVTDAEELARQRQLLKGESRATLSADLPAAERAQAVFERLHAEVLVGRYDQRATDLRRTLSGGDFNCLSALVLYIEHCTQAGVPLEIWSQPGHVHCRLPGYELRIEPTCRQWPGSSRHAPPLSVAARRIAPVELLGKFYYNQGVELLERQQFERGVAQLRIACQLDPRDGDARGNLLAGLNNWAVALAAEGRHVSAAELIASGLKIDPAFPALLANEQYLGKQILRSPPFRP